MWEVDKNHIKMEAMSNKKGLLKKIKDHVEKNKNLCLNKYICVWDKYSRESSQALKNDFSVEVPFTGH